MKRSTFNTFLACTITAVILVACGGWIPAKVGGTVSGLGTGKTLVLRNNATETISISANGAFSFTADFFPGGIYNVAILANPVGQVCTLTNGYGAIDANVDSVTNIQITCADGATISGNLTGLTSGTNVTLTNNGANSLGLSADGPFSFTTAVAAGSSYAVAVGTQPTGELCLVTNGAGTIDTTLTLLHPVAVDCAAAATVGGAVTGLAAGHGVQLINNADTTGAITVAANGNFTFATPVRVGSPYNVTVLIQPSPQFCTVTLGSGTVADANAVSTVAVACQ